MMHATLLAQNQDLTIGGWTMLVGCVGLVCALCAFCYYRILREPKPSDHHHAPPDIDTHD
jgi:hypothetical protein